MDRKPLLWIYALPEVGGSFLERAMFIQRRKDAAVQAMRTALELEAELYLDIRKSGHWSEEELTQAFVKMSPSAVDFVHALLSK